MNELCEMSKHTEMCRLRLLRDMFFKKPQPYYIEVMPGWIYETSQMETLLMDFDKNISKFKALRQIVTNNIYSKG